MTRQYARAPPFPEPIILPWGDQTPSDSDDDETRLDEPEDEEHAHNEEYDYDLSQTPSINQRQTNCPTDRTPTRGSHRTTRGRRGGRGSHWYELEI